MGNVYNFVVAEGQDLVSDNNENEGGRVIKRYNIPLGEVEYYFIPSSHLSEYESAHFKQDLDAHKKLGTQLMTSGN